MKHKKTKAQLCQCCCLFFILFSISYKTYSRENTEVQTEHNKSCHYLSYNGQMRIRTEKASNFSLPDLSYNNTTLSAQTLERMRLNMTLRENCNSASPINNIKTYFELQSYYVNGDANSPSYVWTGDIKNPLKPEIYQAYIKTNVRTIRELPLQLRIGRQELVYGDTFFLGANDFYDGLPYDAIKLSYTKTKSRKTIETQPQAPDLQIDLFAAKLVESNPQNKNINLYGFYSTHNEKTDIYLIRRKIEQVPPDNEKLYAAGIRRIFTLSELLRSASKQGQNIEIELEHIRQFGKKGNPNSNNNDNIKAFAHHIDISIPVKPASTISLHYVGATGDNDDTDSEFKEFTQPYHDVFHTGDISIIPDVSGIELTDAQDNTIRASGMKIFVAAYSIDLNSRTNLNLDYHKFRAERTPAGFNKSVGSEINAILTYQYSDNTIFTLSANKFTPGAFFSDVQENKSNINYSYLQMQTDF